MMIVENQVILVARILTKRGESEADKISVLHAFSPGRCKSKGSDSNATQPNTIQVLPGDLIRAI